MFINLFAGYMAKMVFEIFTEELPATLQKKIVADFDNFIRQELKKNDFMGNHYNNCFIFTGITINRLVCKIENCDIIKEQLKKIINTTLKEFSKTFPRTMHYPQLQLSWIRPIRNIFACIDNDVLNEEFYGIKTTNFVYVNKFDAVECHSVEEYEEIISNNNIVLDYNKRVEFVGSQIGKNDKNGDYNNNSLVNEIAGMSEYCVEPMIDYLDNKFNVLPFELIELVLRENQRYVVFKPNNEGKIKFLIFGDKNTEEVKKGHRKVVNARLDDALFYWKLDEKNKADKAKLKDILTKKIFIDDITWGEYLNEQEKLADTISGMPSGTRWSLIWDTKLDLSTGVVAEFPELQGIIGSYYFGYGFNPYVIDEQSLNKKQHTGGALFYYLIDRIGYIITMYNRGKQPTGSGDKYKVKARMDDIFKVFDLFVKYDLQYFSSIINNVIAKIKENDEIYKLFKKRYQKYIEEKFKDVENVKMFAEVCVKMVDDGKYTMLLSDLENAVKYFNDKEFIKAYKRINGYTGGVVDEWENFINRKHYILEMFLGSIPDLLSCFAEDANGINYSKISYSAINNYLDNNQIAGNDEILMALQYIEEKCFLPKLPLEFLEVL